MSAKQERTSKNIIKAQKQVELIQNKIYKEEINELINKLKKEIKNDNNEAIHCVCDMILWKIAKKYEPELFDKLNKIIFWYS